MDNIIDDAVANAAPVEDAQTDANVIENEAPETAEPQDKGEGEQTDREPWPNTAKNAIARRDKQLAKMRSRYDSLESEVRQLREMMQNGGKAKNAEPSEDQFETYADYLLARAEYRAEQKFNDLSKDKTTPEQAQQDQWMAQRTDELAKEVQVVSKQIPDLVDTIDEYSDVIDEMPQNLQLMLLHSENPIMATYNLIKTGRLEKLSNLPEALAAAEIMQAAKYSPVKKISQAPVPTKTPRAAGNGKQSPDNMSVDEVLKTFIRK